MTTLALGTTEIGLREAAGSFRGMGAVDVAGCELRNGSRGMFVDIRTPDGVSFTNFRLDSVDQQDGGHDLQMSMDAVSGGLMEWMNHEVRNRVSTSDWERRPEAATGTSLMLSLRPVARSFGPFRATGFSYWYAFSSPDYAVYRITDRGTWEIGGQSIGNAVWQRGANPSVFCVESVDQFYSTEWYLASVQNPNIFQFKPFQTQLQGFTMTVAEAGVLVTWATEPAHIRTLIEKKHGRNDIEHWHEHCGDLSRDFRTAPMEVLFIPGTFSAVDLANIYHHVAETVAETLHAKCGLRRERVTTYGVIEEWGLPDMRRYIDEGLPAVLGAGVKCVFLPSMFENNMNTYGVSNMCCTVDYKVAETVGEGNMREFCDVVHAAGADVEMWGNTALSSVAWICNQPNGPKQRIDFLPTEESVMSALADRPDAFVRNASGAIEADHYTPVFCVLNLRDEGVRAYWHRRWQYAREEIGIDRIFLDSSFNLSSDKFHWSYTPAAVGKGATIDQTHLLREARPAEEPPPAILTQYHAHLALMAEMQAYGYTYVGEDIGVFGIHRSGPDAVARMRCPEIWSDSLCQFDAASIRRELGLASDDAFFRGLAYRLMWTLYWHIDSGRLNWMHRAPQSDDENPTDWQIRVLNAYNTVDPLMKRRTVLEDGSGVLYESDAGSVLWSFAEAKLDLGRTVDVCDVLAGRREQADVLAHGPRRIYAWQG